MPSKEIYEKLYSADIVVFDGDDLAEDSFTKVLALTAAGINKSADAPSIPLFHAFRFKDQLKSFYESWDRVIVDIVDEETFNLGERTLAVRCRTLMEDEDISQLPNVTVFVSPLERGNVQDGDTIATALEVENDLFKAAVAELFASIDGYSTLGVTALKLTCANTIVCYGGGVGVMTEYNTMQTLDSICANFGLNSVAHHWHVYPAFRYRSLEGAELEPSIMFTIPQSENAKCRVTLH
jgi:hypothetical protein